MFITLFSYFNTAATTTTLHYYHILLPHSTATATATTATTITTTTTTTTTCTTGNKTRLNGACYKLLNKIIHYVKQIKKKKISRKLHLTNKI